MTYQSTVFAPGCKLIKAEGLINFGGFVAIKEFIHGKRTTPFKHLSPQNLHKDDESPRIRVKLKNS